MSRDGLRLGREELSCRLKARTGEFPADLDQHLDLLNLDDPKHQEASRDRHATLVASRFVDEGLKIAIERVGHTVPRAFDGRIKLAQKLQLVTQEQAAEIDMIRLVRNLFAHSPVPLSFDEPEVTEAASGLWNHPVSSWAGYFAPAFAARHQYAIVCREFYDMLTRDPSVPPSDYED